MIVWKIKHSYEINLLLFLFHSAFQKVTSNSCNTGTSALPDMYARRPRASANISGNALVPVLQLICYTSGTLKICPNLLLNALPIYITRDGNFDYGISF